jgi:lipopolysaccharide/colanic/teichoic acid biosynthesis glycosyltransferase
MDAPNLDTARVMPMPRLLSSSRGRFCLRLSPLDVICAALAPPLALYLRNPQLLSVEGMPIALFYCLLSFIFTLIAFLSFRVSHGISRHFSVHEVVSVISAVIAAGLITTVVLFTFTHLEGIPRSIPILQGLVLAAGLLLRRGLMALWANDNELVPNLVGLLPLPAARQSVLLRLPTAALRSTYELSSYFRYKRLIDFMIAPLAIVLLSPVFLIVSVLVLVDVGSPVVFWQKRMGRSGRSFLLYKFRTLHAPFDRTGQPNGHGGYQSWVGKFVRALRLDELPQLFNVLVGEMSLIGPRPLLPQDQPTNCNLRLMVHPGITGWAQINGGNLVSTEEKGALDDWYVHNASFWLDLRIALYTLYFLFTGERRFEPAIHAANILQQAVIREVLEKEAALRLTKGLRSTVAQHRTRVALD